MASTVGMRLPTMDALFVTPSSTASTSAPTPSPSVICTRRRRPPGHRMAASASDSKVIQAAPPKWRDDKGHRERRSSNSKVGLYEKVDEWMRDSVVDIVRNLREAPLLLQLYSPDAHAVIDKGVREEEWRRVVDKWTKREAPLPQGVIFVEQLPPEEEEEDEEENRAVRAWGIVVQGAGADCGPVCYLLKTSSAAGPGLCCTHFCLMRVQNFRESALSQLTSCWLLQ